MKCHFFILIFVFLVTWGVVCLFICLFLLFFFCWLLNSFANFIFLWFLICLSSILMSFSSLCQFVHLFSRRLFFFFLNSTIPVFFYSSFPFFLSLLPFPSSFPLLFFIILSFLSCLFSSFQSMLSLLFFDRCPYCEKIWLQLEGTHVHIIL